MQCDKVSLSLSYITVTIHAIKIVRILLMRDRMNKLWNPQVYVLLVGKPEGDLGVDGWIILG
jgi:hypothetical protein